LWSAVAGSLLLNLLFLNPDVFFIPSGSEGTLPEHRVVGLQQFHNLPVYLAVQNLQ
jgi:hypothetical protein